MNVTFPRVGVWMGHLSMLDASAERAAVQELEEIGYRAFWFAEGPGTREAFAHAATLLSWTCEVIVATGIASIYVRDARAMANGAAALADGYPRRFVLGIGVSHAPMVSDRGHSYGAPVATMRRYLEDMECAVYEPPAPAHPAPVVLAALGPQMLRLAAERTSGVHPYLTPPAHTAFARDIVGPRAFVAPEQTVLLETRREKARELAQTFVSYYLGLDNYVKNLQRLGFTDDDFVGGGSARLMDEIVSSGGVDAICARVRAHLDAGADHVCVRAIGPEPLAALRRLAPALLAM